MINFKLLPKKIIEKVSNLYKLKIEVDNLYMSLNEWNYSEGNKLFYSAICFTLTNIKSTFNLFKFTQN